MAVGNVNPIPSRAALQALTVRVATVTPDDAQAIAIPVWPDGEVNRALGLSREELQALDFTGETGQALRLPRADGPTLIAVGVGDTAASTGLAAVRDAAAAFARASARYGRLAVDLTVLTTPELAGMAQAVVEGVILARYRWDELKARPRTVALTELVIVTSAAGEASAAAGAARGKVLAAAGALARDLANSPPSYLTAIDFAEIAAAIAPEADLTVEIWDKAALTELGAGGLLGVNRGSVREPRMVKLTYDPGETATGHLGLVGKTLVYDSGGISLKPSNASHATMKTDMSGGGAVLAAMSALRDLDCPAKVTAWMVVTDNMPDGAALGLGDVLTMYGGKTVEVMNTDAEGRLIMADALVLADEAGVDGIIDISTLTGACLMALGPMTAGVLGNNATLVGQIEAAAAATDEPVWELPLNRRYRKWLDSDIADIRNLGGESAGAITAALFLEEFVNGRPWAHLDIAGTAYVNADNSWQAQGGTGFGARLLAEVAVAFTPPAGN